MSEKFVAESNIFTFSSQNFKEEETVQTSFDEAKRQVMLRRTALSSLFQHLTARRLRQDDDRRKLKQSPKEERLVSASFSRHI